MAGTEGQVRRLDAGHGDRRPAAADIRQQRVHPPANLPGVLRWWSSVNPVSHLAGAVRALLTGAPVGPHVWVTLAWATAVSACFVPLAVRAYTRRIR
ncbi:hypothetical protein GCM10027612_30920 [Microbispora bryophytorum subsp. camponoti]